MKLPFLLMFTFSQLSTVTAQKQPKLFIAKDNTNCVYKAAYSAAQRHQFYPFNITDTIKLVSFSYYHANYPFSRDTLLTDSLIEIKMLSIVQVNKLTDILYNNFYKKKPNYGQMPECFIPHNAILFFGKAGKLKELVSICFHCADYEKSSRKN